MWIYAPVGPDGSPLSSMVYEIVPGFLLSALAIVVVSLLDRAPPAAVTGVFDTVRARLAQPAARAR